MASGEAPVSGEAGWALGAVRQLRGLTIRIGGIEQLEETTHVQYTYRI